MEKDLNKSFSRDSALQYCNDGAFFIFIFQHIKAHQNFAV